MRAIHYRYAEVGGQRPFYREAGASGVPAVVLLLHTIRFLGSTLR